MLRYYTAGESHGKTMLAMVDGFPAGLEVDPEKINRDLKLRQGGYGRGKRQELETDKVTVEVPAPQAGVLSEVLVGEDDNVAVGALLGRIGEANGAAVAAPQPAAAAAPAPAPSAPAASGVGDPLAAAGPAVKKAAAEAGVTAAQISPTGREGRATKAEVQARVRLLCKLSTVPAIDATASSPNR